MSIDNHAANTAREMLNAGWQAIARLQRDGLIPEWIKTSSSEIIKWLPKGEMQIEIYLIREGDLGADIVREIQPDGEELLVKIDKKTGKKMIVISYDPKPESIFKISRCIVSADLEVKIDYCKDFYDLDPMDFERRGINLWNYESQ